MNAQAAPTFRFASPAQWASGLRVRHDAAASEALRPMSPFGPKDTFPAEGGAVAPAIAPDGEALWRDAAGRLARLEAGEPVRLQTAPFALAHAPRLVAGTRQLWAAQRATGSLQAFGRDDLVRRLAVVVGGDLIDIADDLCDGVWVLRRHDATVDALRVDCAGHVRERRVLDGVGVPVALAAVQRARVLAILDSRSVLHLRGDGVPPQDLALDTLRPCFAATQLAGDGRERLVVGGRDGAPFGATPALLLLDAQGQVVAQHARADEATGLALRAGDLLVAHARGVDRLAAQARVPDTGEAADTEFLSPVLEAPPTPEGRQWLRVEADVSLPEGASLELSWATTDDAALAARASAIARDPHASASQRLARVRALFDGAWSPMVFQGRGDAPPKRLFAAPLFDLHRRFVWVHAALAAAPGAALPALHELRVRAAGPTLMQHLPAVYQRAEARPGDFLRALVGVLETTSQELDARIASLGGLVHPSTAPEPWLDAVARWLGLPWHASLSATQKRCLLCHAAELAAWRGTRTGLERLLECLLPGPPRRHRITDWAVDHGVARAGVRLPAMLGGAAARRLVLGGPARLGMARLAGPPACDERCDATARLSQLQVEVQATPAERAAWQAWLGSVVQAMVPLPLRVRLRWVARLDTDDTIELREPSRARLGGDAVLGEARLSDRGEARLGPDGLSMGARLQ